MVLLAVLLSYVAVTVSADEPSPGSTLVSALYDSKIKQFENQTLSYNDFKTVFDKNGYYQFTDFKDGFQHYSELPTLVVFQPDEKINELHGYYIPGGLATLMVYKADDPATFEQFKPVRDYFVDNSTESATPYAARDAFPYFYEHRMVKFVAADDVAPKFGVVFVAPTRLRRPNITDYQKVVGFYLNEKNNSIHAGP